MNRIIFILALTLLAALSATPLVAADIPQTINLQGKLTDSAGSFVADGIYSVVFRVYDDSVAGAELWSETLPVQVTDGLFTAIVGITEGIPKDIFYNSPDRYLGVTVNLEPEMPRIALNSVAYAYQTKNADEATLATDLICAGCVSATEVDPTQIQLRVAGTASPGQYITGINQDGTVTTALDANNAYTAGTGLTLGGNQFSISPNGVTSTEIAPGAVLGGLAGDIADGTITADDLAASSVGTSEIDVAAVGSSEIATDGVTAPDIAAGAVGASEVLDGSLTAIDIDDEPGVASNTSNSLMTMNGTVQTLSSRSIIAPAAGYVLAIATAEVLFFHADLGIESARFGVSSIVGTMPANQGAAVSVDGLSSTSNFTQVVTVHGLFSTPGGADTYYFLGEEVSGAFSVTDFQFTLVYFPTAHGTVDSTAASSGEEVLSTQSVGADLNLMESGGGPIQPQAGEGPRQESNLAEIQQELARVRAETAERIQKIEEQLLMIATQTAAKK